MLYGVGREKEVESNVILCWLSFWNGGCISLAFSDELSFWSMDETTHFCGQWSQA